MRHNLFDKRSGSYSLIQRTVEIVDRLPGPHGPQSTVAISIADARSGPGADRRACSRTASAFVGPLANVVGNVLDRLPGVLDGPDDERRWTTRWMPARRLLDQRVGDRQSFELPVVARRVEGAPIMTGVQVGSLVVEERRPCLDLVDRLAARPLASAVAEIGMRQAR